jgi:nucleotide-binding universal stress UspA family protein
MNGPTVDTPAVVVGIDGSKKAVRVALWAVDEAVSRDAELRLLYVADLTRGCSRADLDSDDALFEARLILEAAGKPVKIASEVRRGNPVDELVGASRSAALICVGPGSSAAKVAQSALSPVAIVRQHFAFEQNGPRPWVIAALGESLGSRSVFATAIREAKLRSGSVVVLTPWTAVTRGQAGPDQNELRIAVDDYLGAARRGTGDIVVCAVPQPRDILHLVAETRYMDQLVVVNRRNCALVKELTGSKARWILRKTNCSVLIDGGPA